MPPDRPEALEKAAEALRAIDAGAPDLDDGWSSDATWANVGRHAAGLARTVLGETPAWRESATAGADEGARSSSPEAEQERQFAVREVEAMLEAAHDRGYRAGIAIEHGQIEDDDPDALPFTIEGAVGAAEELLGRSIVARSPEAVPAEAVVHLPSGKKGTALARGVFEDYVTVRWERGGESKVDPDELRKMEGGGRL